MQNMMWAMIVVQMPLSTPMLRNCEPRPEPSTTSGVAIGRNSSRVRPVRKRKRNRTSAMAIAVPRAAATRVATKPTTRLLPKAATTRGSASRVAQFSSEKPRQLTLVRAGMLNENTIVYAIGISSTARMITEYTATPQLPRRPLGRFRGRGVSSKRPRTAASALTADPPSS